MKDMVLHIYCAMSEIQILKPLQLASTLLMCPRRTRSLMRAAQRAAAQGCTFKLDGAIDST